MYPMDPVHGGSLGVSAAADWWEAPPLILEQQLCTQGSTSDEGVMPRAAEGMVYRTCAGMARPWQTHPRAPYTKDTPTGPKPPDPPSCTPDT